MAAPAGGDAGGKHNSSSSMEAGGKCNSSSPMDAGELDQTWVESLWRRLKSKPNILREEAGSSSCCIHRVPPTLRQHDQKAYTPLVVSLGPFHRRNKRLRAMEEHKWRFLDKAVSRAATTTRNGLETFLSAIKELEQAARQCYSEIIPLDSCEFVQMMVLDGCFILQIVLIGECFLPCDENDPIFCQSWLLGQIIEDMLLLENQIPFSVLQVLFDLMKSSMQISDSLVSIFSEYFQCLKLYKHSGNVTNPTHLLHLLQLCLLPDTNRLPTNPTIEEIPSATRLREAGVKFKCVNGNGLLDIIFEDGELRIPQLCIGDEIYSHFPNLLAFEQCYTNYCGQHITAYRKFMDWLIDSADDVLILRREGIIKSRLGSDEEVADLFNKLGRDVVISRDCFYLSDVVKDINCYCCRPWHYWRAHLIEKYFYNPWAIISLIGAMVLLLLTTLQTFFAVFSYVKPPS